VAALTSAATDPTQTPALLPGGGGSGAGAGGGRTGPDATTPADADRSLMDPTAWWWYVNIDATTLSNHLTQDNARIIDLKVVNVNPYRFDAVLVRNTGSYGQAWWWYYDLTASDLANQITGRRLTDLEVYNNAAGQQRFAAVLLPNTGSEGRAWWYYYNASPDYIGARLQENHARLVDLDTYVSGGQRYYEAIMVANQGIDAKAWWWYVNVSPAYVSSQLQANHARLLDLSWHSDGQMSVVMVPLQPGDHWWWYYGQDVASLGNHLAQNGSRLIDLETRTVGGQTQFAAIMLNNSNDLTTRVGDIIRGATDSAIATTGFYLKKVGGPVLAGLEDDHRFEPASMIKVLIHLHAMRQVQAGTVRLNDPIDYYYAPNDPNNVNVCPDSYPHTASNRVTTTLQDALSGMMMVSDNRKTQAVEQRFGPAAINATAALAGMTNSVLANVTIGCGAPGNYLTLDDAGRLYEGVVNGTLLNPSTRATFYQLMLHGVGTGFLSVIQDEAARQLNKPPSDPAVQSLKNAFFAGMQEAGKGGSYRLGYDPTYWRDILTGGAHVALPFHNANQQVVLQEYVHGVFVENALIPRNNPDPLTQRYQAAFSLAETELYRDEIRAALATWKPGIPTGLTATPVSYSQINLSWASVAGASGYKVERSPNGSSNWTQIATTGAVTTYADSGLSGGTRYYYRVRAFTIGGDGNYSPVASALTYVAPPPNLTAAPRSTSAIHVSWGSATGTNGYKIERSPDGLGGWSQVGTTTATVTVFDDTGLTASTAYYYRVRGFNATGDGASSSVTGTTTLAVVGLQVTVSPATVTAGAAFTITVTALDAQNGVADGYRGTVTFTTSDPSGGTLPYDYTFTAGDGGVHVFSGGAALYTAGDQSVTATDTADSSITGSAAVTVTPDVAAYFGIAAPDTVTSGVPFDFTLYVFDAYGNLATGYTGTLTFYSSSDPDAQVPPDYTFAGDEGGSVYFPAGATLFAEGIQDLTAEDPANGLLGSAYINVVSGAFAGLGMRRDSRGITLPGLDTADGVHAMDFGRGAVPGTLTAAGPSPVGDRASPERIIMRWPESSGNRIPPAQNEPFTRHMVLHDVETGLADQVWARLDGALLKDIIKVDF
jgi:hypothetical protein